MAAAESNAETEPEADATGDGEQAAGEALERGRLLFTMPCTLLAVAGRLDQLPDGRLPEVAFAGRSNVGKSSLINALVARKGLAKTSNTPGRTQQLVFFDLGGRLTLADLPGYGYAEAPKEQVARWTRLVENYFKGRAALRRALLLIDGRHGVKPVDRQVMAMLDNAAVSYQVVLTKCDKVAQGELALRQGSVAAILAGHTAAHPQVLMTSARTGLGLDRLRAALAALLQPGGLPAA